MVQAEKLEQRLWGRNELGRVSSVALGTKLGRAADESKTEKEARSARAGCKGGLSTGCCNRIPQPGWLTQQTFISHSLEAGSLRSACQHGWVLVKGPLLVAHLSCPYLMEK